MNAIARSHRLPLWLAVGISSLCTSVDLVAQDPPKKKEPLRINNWIGGPSYLKFSGQHRSRFESLNGQFRTNPATLRDTEDQLANRSILRVDYTRNEWGATLEGLDGRTYGTEDNSFVDNTTVNTVDVLQANVSYELGQLGDGKHELTVGRYTMDIGSRRLSARNEYRNTINSFNGVRWDWQTDDGHQAGAFWSMPTWILPDARLRLVDNGHELDTQSLDYQFFGAHYTRPVDEHSTGQAYVLGLYDDRNNVPKRELWTTGLRYNRPERRGHTHAQVEAAYQFGKRATDDVSAYFAHASIGYTLDSELEPAVRLAYDIATGDDSGSSKYGRFDTLFGARRFEYGPTGIYGAIGRRNLISPEVRFSIRPSPTTWFMVAWRDVRLESGSDQWVEARDGTGQGKSVGQQVECRLRWEPCKSNLRFETGGAYFSGGRFRETSTAGRSTDTRYFYFETIFTF